MSSFLMAEAGPLTGDGERVGGIGAQRGEPSRYVESVGRAARAGPLEPRVGETFTRHAPQRGIEQRSPCASTSCDGGDAEGPEA